MRLALATILALCLLQSGAALADNATPIAALFPRGSSEPITTATNILQSLHPAERLKIVSAQSALVDNTLIFGSPGNSGFISGKFGEFPVDKRPRYFIRSTVLDGHPIIVLGGLTDQDVQAGAQYLAGLIKDNTLAATLAAGPILPPQPPPVPGVNGSGSGRKPTEPGPKPGRNAGSTGGTGTKPPPPEQPDWLTISIGAGLLLLISILTLIVVLYNHRALKMHGSAVSPRMDTLEDRISVLEGLVNQLQERLQPSEAAAPPQTERVHRVEQTQAFDYSDVDRDLFVKQEEARPPKPFARREQFDEEFERLPDLHTLLADYHGLIANRLASVNNFSRRYSAYAIQPTTEAQRYRSSTDAGEDNLWAIPVPGDSNRALILPGPGMIRRWSLFAKASASAARPYLNGAYEVQPSDRGGLSILSPAVARIDRERQILVLSGVGSLSGAA